MDMVWRIAEMVRNILVCGKKTNDEVMDALFMRGEFTIKGFLMTPIVLEMETTASRWFKI